jgi:hypothetical protein
MTPESARPAIYRIRVRGSLDERWGQWLGGVTITTTDSPDETLFTGVLADQAALLGLLQQLDSLRLKLLEVRLEEQAPEGARFA